MEIKPRKEWYQEQCKNCKYNYCKQGDCEQCLNRGRHPQAENSQLVCCCFDPLCHEDVLPYCTLFQDK